jgi:hypothetical protein
VPKPGFSFLLDSSHPSDFTIQWLPFLFLSKESNQTSTSYLKKKKKKRNGPGGVSVPQLTWKAA